MRHFRIVFPAVTLPARVAGFWESLRKKFEKTFGKIWKITEKVLTFAADFPLNRGAETRAIFDEFT